MPVPNVNDGELITESWGDAVADSVNALEAADTAHAAAANPHPAYATDSDLTAHAAAADPHPGYTSAAELAAHAAAGHAAGMVHTANFLIDGGGVLIATGLKGDLAIDYACTITKWTLLADQSGSIAVAVWKDSYANFPPVIGDVIVTPAIAGALKAQSGALSLAIAAGDVLRFNVNSVTSIQRVTLALTIART